jgi:DNA oxidative demethylase
MGVSRFHKRLRSIPPPGFEYAADFLNEAEQLALTGRLERLAFEEIHMHGVIARRKVIHYGMSYGYDERALYPTTPLPDFLKPLRSRLARWARVPEASFAEILLSRYEPGAPIGWHRDAPMFDVVVGVSLGSPCRFRMRRRQGAFEDCYTQILDPGSAYRLSGEARWQWQHHIPPVEDLRFSITFRTLKEKFASTG